MRSRFIVRRAFANVVLATGACVWSVGSIAQIEMPQCSSSAPAGGWTNCLGVWVAPDGGKYTGEWRNGKPDGRGSYVYPKGGVYVGEWRNGAEDGDGIYTWTSGQRYEGRWREGKRDGWGVQTYVGGDRYVGFWQNDVRAGQGVLYNQDGSIGQAGIWSNGLLNVVVFLDVKRFPFVLEVETLESSPGNQKPSSDDTSLPRLSADERVRRCIGAGARPGTSEFSRCMNE